MSNEWKAQILFTLPETNILAPENGWLQKKIVSFWETLFSGAFAVSFREGSFFFFGGGAWMNESSLSLMVKDVS